jgi:MinD superfamily P-loop ATPase
MKQLLILSGKGGTGKTTIASAFIELSKAKAFADCDVDAPNLHLIHRVFDTENKHDYFGMDKAFIDPNICINCGLCKDNCRFEAIHSDYNHNVDPFACEGCGVCEMLCPVDAIQMVRAKAGELSVFEGQSIFATATLKMGSGTSGLLVSQVKKKLKDTDFVVPLAIIDGSPGIGCPVISSISGVDMVLIVTEPSVSGVSDMKRIIETAKIFNPKLAVCINKYDTNHFLSEVIENYCTQNRLSFVGSIPYDTKVVKAVNSGVSIVSKPSAAGDAVRRVYDQTIELLFEESSEPLFKVNQT